MKFHIPRIGKPMTLRVARFPHSTHPTLPRAERISGWGSDVPTTHGFAGAQ